MATRPAPNVPDYRITLFYGPEAAAAPPHDRHCVYNVKKRSWKGGIQADVWISEPLIERASDALAVSAWLDTALRNVAAEDAAHYRERAQDAFVQQLCLVKLELAIADGLLSENSRLETDRLASELLQALPGRAAAIRDAILAELDLAQPT